MAKTPTTNDLASRLVTWAVALLGLVFVITAVHAVNPERPAVMPQFAEPSTSGRWVVGLALQATSRRATNVATLGLLVPGMLAGLLRVRPPEAAATRRGRLATILFSHYLKPAIAVSRPSGTKSAARTAEDCARIARACASGRPPVPRQESPTMPERSRGGTAGRQ